MSYMERKSGVLMHVSSLWGNYSEGSLGTEALEWVDFLADCGFGVWQVLPFCLPDEFNSPYKSFSAFSLNPNLIDLISLHNLGLITAAELCEAEQKTPFSCEFDRLSNERMALLAKAAERFGESEELDEFFQNHKQTAEFCRFMALREANGNTPWTEWTINTPDEKALRTWRFTQYIFFIQWSHVKEYANRRGISIIGDIPIYVAYDSADVFSNPTQFQLDKNKRPTLVAGVPPDYFCEDGQLWGNPLYDWKAMRSDGYAWWKERLSFMCELFDGVRIDHFRGIESYYSIPANAKNAKNGKWKKGPGMDLIRALKSVCGDKLLIAEDLGDITPAVYKLVKDSGFPGMRVLQFGFLGDANSPHLPHNYDNNCIAYTGTHDNNTLLGYIWELDEITRRRVLAYCGYAASDWDRSYDAILRTMFASHAGLLVLPVQDLLLYGSDTRFNVPGRSDGNWSYRLTRDQLKTIDRAKFREWNRMYGRVENIW